MILKKSVLVVSALVAFVPAVTFAALMNTVPVTTGGGSVVPGLVTANPGTLLAQASLSGGYLNFNDSKVTDYSIEEAVYKNSSGAVDFYFQVASSYTSPFGGPPQNSQNSIIQAFIANFGTYLTSVGYRPDGSALTGASGFTTGTIAPSTAMRGTDGFSHNAVFFNFGAGLTAGAVSDLLIVSTNASSFKTNGDLGISDNASEGSSSNDLSFYSPDGPIVIPAVPDAGSSALLLGLGLIFLVGVTRRLRLQREV